MAIPEGIVSTKVCVVCGQEFQVEHRYKQYQGREACSKPCIGKLAFLRKQGLLPNVLEAERHCAACGQPFIATRRSQGISFPEFCSRDCLAIGLSQRKRDDSWVREAQRICVACGKEFAATRRRKRAQFQQTCSLECQTHQRKSNLKRQCRHCGAIFYQQRSVVRLSANGGCFCSQDCCHAFQAASKTRVAGRKMDRGYVLLHAPDHPYARRKYVYEHRLVMERLLDRYLEPHENVHHIDGNRANNAPENLELWVSPQPSGQRAIDLYKHDAERLGRENLVFKQRIADLEAELAALRVLQKE